jgi:hypothetical protein
MAHSLQVTVWNEYRHEQTNAAVAAIYPHGIHATIAQHLRGTGLAVHTATLDEPEHGLTPQVLAQTDVLIWWGHAAHEQVRDEVVERVHQRVLDGMGLIVLHSGHFSKIFKRLMGTTCDLKWREMGEKERIWVVEPGHPIAEGLGEFFEIPQAEMYGERFDIPAPGLCQLVPGRRGVPQRVLLPSRQRQGLLLSPRSRDLSHLSSGGSAAGDHQCRTLGRADHRTRATIRAASRSSGADQICRMRRNFVIMSKN